MIGADPSLPTSGVREMAAALGLIGSGDRDGLWEAQSTDAAEAGAGALSIQKATGDIARIYFAANERAGVQMEINGVVSKDDADAIIIHSTAPVPEMARSPRSALGRTGHLALRQVGMADLLRNASNVGELRNRFREESSL